ncbi:MAG: molybdopterin-containing oxidoreductase family protein [Dehalococcoidia bacterium]
MRPATQLVKTTCQLCHLGCGMNVYVEEGRIVKVEGMSEHPFNKGVLCPKGEAVIEYVYSPDRLKYPLKKKNDGWQRISWNEALDIVVDKMTEVKSTYGAKAFAVAIGMSILLSGSVTVGLIRRFCYAFGSPNCFSVESMCYRCRVISYLLTYGRFRVADPGNSRCIILWGHNPTNSNPVLTDSILRAKDKGATVIVIDPRRIPLARTADIHLQPRPGTDCALILGLLNVIISRGLYDKEFVDKWTLGFERLAEHVKLYTPSYVEKITWVAADAIEKLAQTYATTKPACIVQGTNALDQHRTGIQNGRGVAILQAVTGNVDVPGGFIRAPRLRENPIEMPTKPQEAAIGQKEYPVFYSVLGREFGEGQAMLLCDNLLTGEPYPIKMMIVTGSNPLLTWPDSRKVKQAFQKLDFLVVMDQFMTQTAKMADLVLPAATFLERTELSDYYSLWGLAHVMLRKKVIQYEECWPDLKFWFELAHRLGYGQYFPWKTIEEAIDYVLEPSGLTLKRLTVEKPEGVTYGSVKYKEYESEGFRTPSGKVELYSETLAGLGYHPMPTFEEPPESPESTPELTQQYPLILTTGARILEFCHSQHRNISRLRQRSLEPLVEINPATAARYGIADGDMVTVSTRRGSIEIKARVFEDIMPGVVCISHGWDEANVNILTSQEPADPIIGYPALKALLCRIERKV